MPHRTLGFRAAIGALNLSLAAACAVGPDYRAPPPPATPAAYTAADAGLEAAAPADRWWDLMNDPVLDGLVRDALADSPDVVAAEARIRQSRALARAAGASFLPSVNASGRVSRDKLSRNGENLALIPFNPPTTQFTDYRIGIDASWEIDLAGGTRRDRPPHARDARGDHAPDRAAATRRARERIRPRDRPGRSTRQRGVARSARGAANGGPAEAGGADRAAGRRAFASARRRRRDPAGAGSDTGRAAVDAARTPARRAARGARARRCDGRRRRRRGRAVPSTDARRRRRL